MKTLLLTFALGTAFLAAMCVNAQVNTDAKFPKIKTAIDDKRAAEMLAGRHRMALQWVSWDYFGTAFVSNRKGRYAIKGEQKSRRGTDFVRIDGIITSVDTKNFSFAGTIVTQISHINNGSPCTRDGEFTFRITGTRRYWRLAEMKNPCSEVTDYVDIYLR
ncbi:MAG: hypothetical protein WKF34_09885 [Pyrinomonadaceae bacterium]